MIALYMINSNSMITDARGDDISWLREQADKEYPPAIARASRLTVTHKMPNYAQATVTYPDIEKPIFITYSGAYIVYERKDAV